MIEAVEYTRKMDDGARPEEWAKADLLILGVSRCGKTPLSIYLGQRGYKVRLPACLPELAHAWMRGCLVLGLVMLQDGGQYAMLHLEVG